MKEHITTWQRALLAHGYEVEPDGVFGPGTLRASLKSLQGDIGGNGKHSLTIPDRFFLKVREKFGALTQGQVDGFNHLLNAMERWPLPWAAYALGTVWHESAATMKPIKEYGGDAYFHKMYDPEGERPHVAKSLGNARPGDGVKYAGRGYAMITGRANYRKFGIENDPEKALKPDCAAFILMEGMEKGMFTGKKMADYLTGQTDYVGARRIINGQDRAQMIAGYAKDFETALVLSGW